MSNKKEKAAKKTIFDLDLTQETTKSLRLLRHQFYARRTHASKETAVLCNKRIKQLHDILVARKKEEQKEKAAKAPKKVTKPAKKTEKKATKKAVKKVAKKAAPKAEPKAEPKHEPEQTAPAEPVLP